MLDSTWPHLTPLIATYSRGAAATMPRRPPAAAQPPQHDTRQPLPPLQGLQVRMFLPTPLGPVAHTIEPRCSARWGEHYAPCHLWCGYCDDWHHRSDFSAQQCAAGRDVRYCLNYSQVSQAELPRHRAEPSRQACHRLFTSGALSLNGRRILAINNGDGMRVRDERLSNSLGLLLPTPTPTPPPTPTLTPIPTLNQAEDHFRSQWDAEEQSRADWAAGTAVGALKMRLRWVEQLVPPIAVNQRFKSTEWLQRFSNAYGDAADETGQACAPQ